MTIKFARFIGLAILSATTVAIANVLPDPGAFQKYADPNGVVLAVDASGLGKGNVRLSVYDSEQSFLDAAASKHQAAVNDDGVAVMRLGALTPGAYAFAAYFDENGDGVLNRGKLVGKPKEPYAFSNGAKPKLRKPKFNEAKVDVVAGSVVVIELKD